MSKSAEEIKAILAQAKARAQAVAQQLQQQQQQQSPAAAPPAPGLATTTGNSAAIGRTPTAVELRQRAEALKAKLQGLNAAKLGGIAGVGSSSLSQKTAPSTITSAGIPSALGRAGVADSRGKGGLAIDVSSMLSRDEAGNLIINAVKAGNTTKVDTFATVKVNRKPEPKKELKILDVPEDFTDPTKNPYFDPSMALVAPRERRARPLRFAQKGKYTSIANQLRSEQRIEQLRKEIEESGKANVQDEDLQLKDGFTKREVLKDGVEWWDAAFLPNKTYQDAITGLAQIETEDSLITHYVQHPVPIEPPNDPSSFANAQSRPLMLTTKERKKLRRQKRQELLKEKQDKIRLGLLPAEAPKVRLANMMRVLGQEAVLNPTEVEMRVREQVQQRLQTHLDANAQRKLTHDERKAKEQKKKDEDVAKGIYVNLYKINDLSHPQKKFKVDKNAGQLGLTGIVLMYPTFSLVVVEGGQKAVKQFKKLMLRRIDWADNTRLDGTEVSETTDNKCLLVWEGQLRERQFKTFRFIKSRTEAQLKETLARLSVQHYWDQALGFKEEDMLGAEVVL
ncbi:hypothetical protein BGW38_002382 [Lunasporangiospora selenospora]|uniref:Uncharacterized protein n=1 Tax=Lunasporangiospora selenospora TaxID=979761 RepID=A0A9P6KHV4_9FUNG|nr:hypothetical protein BGW38_002382 [Lunasporangiospora selenospora]